MLTRVVRYSLLLALSLEWRVALHAQAAPAGESPMLKPPPVSGQSYRTEVGMEERSNYISGGITAAAGYIDNLYPGQGLGNVGETTLSLQPTIGFDAKSARQHTSALYSPSFIFYEPTSTLNEADHNALFDFQYRFSPRLNVGLSDRFVRSSTGFGQFGSGGVSGGTQTTTSAIVLPFGERFSNDATGSLSYQFSPHGMIGGFGNVGFLNYPNKSQVSGLYNSDSRGTGGFYNHRLSASQYLGTIYNYEQILAYPSSTGQYETQTHTIDGFYTLYLTETFSLSVAGGPQYYKASHAPSPTTAAWAPSFTTSMGWRGLHTSFAADFSRTVTGGGGLLGAFHARTAGAQGRWQVSRLWDTGLRVNYTINKNATPTLTFSSPGGHSFTTSLVVGRILTTHSRVALTYDRIQNRYDGISSVATNPSSDRVMMSFYWEFQRPIGR